MGLHLAHGILDSGLFKGLLKILHLFVLSAHLSDIIGYKQSHDMAGAGVAVDKEYNTEQTVIIF